MHFPAFLPSSQHVCPLGLKRYPSGKSNTQQQQCGGVVMLLTSRIGDESKLNLFIHFSCVQTQSKGTGNCAQIHRLKPAVVSQNNILR